MMSGAHANFMYAGGYHHREFPTPFRKSSVRSSQKRHHRPLSVPSQPIFISFIKFGKSMNSASAVNFMLAGGYQPGGFPMPLSRTNKNRGSSSRGSRNHKTQSSHRSKQGQVKKKGRLFGWLNRKNRSNYQRL
uniref:Ovule protein n=1 Tax=Strongyloides papillosus TaxID=174720 RepID=A0A0N5BTR9_STREA